jgi:putative glutamine amidotransferase
MPVLAICRGIQTLNVATGGTLWQDISAQVPDAVNHPPDPNASYHRLTHTVKLVQGSRLAEIFGERELQVNSLHHQASKDIGDGLRVTARATDGIIEGLENDSDAYAWVVGVQWHPEWLLEIVPQTRQLFQAFVSACKAYRASDKKGRNS